MTGVLSEADQKEEILRARERDALRRKDNEFVLFYLCEHFLPYYHDEVLVIILVDLTAWNERGALRSAATSRTLSPARFPRSHQPSVKSCMCGMYVCAGSS